MIPPSHLHPVWRVFSWVKINHFKPTRVFLLFFGCCTLHCTAVRPERPSPEWASSEASQLTAAEVESEQSRQHNMEFIGSLLTKSRFSVSNIYHQSPPDPQPAVEAENNDMLRLHLNLSESLNKSTEKTQEKISLFYVTIITIVSRITSCHSRKSKHKIIPRFSVFSQSISSDGMTTDSK